VSIVALEEAEDALAFGGKAFHLGEARRVGLPVPPGHAVSVEALAQIVRGDPAIIAQVRARFGELGAPVAVRSSAIGEDAEDASFAGQHLTCLNLMTDDAVVDGFVRVYHSAHSEAALGYRKKKNLSTEIRVAALMQKLVDPICAGVLFTRNPVTGADERVIEAAWGLGETVVAGLVTPDHYRVARDGRVLEARVGDKDIAVRRAASGGTHELAVEPRLIAARCLDADWLLRLHELATRCEAHFGLGLDLEWARVDDTLYLLQSRPISTGRAA
jgi:pyruvate,water dikinase